MEPKMKWVINRMPRSADENLPIMSQDNIAKARTFHRSFPQYSVTPLANLSHMADLLGLGGLTAIMRDPEYEELRDALELNADSKVLLFSTEGDTDPELYRRIIQDGKR